MLNGYYYERLIFLLQSDAYIPHILHYMLADLIGIVNIHLLQSIQLQTKYLSNNLNWILMSLVLNLKNVMHWLCYFFDLSQI